MKIFDAQSSNVVLMVRPANFGFNEEAAETNAFMQTAKTLNNEEVKRRAQQEFDGLVEALRAVGVTVVVVEDSNLPVKPDAVFPNNWFSTHPNGVFVTYPMQPESRRIERLNPVKEVLAKAYTIDRTIALEHAEDDNQFLEGTGSLVLDRVKKVAYACRSERTHEGLAKRWASLTGYELIFFDAVDEGNMPVYHTNVIMAMGTHHAVICLQSIVEVERDMVRRALTDSGRQIIDLSFHQILHFAGNMLEVVDGKGNPVWAMSSQAHDALSEVQRTVLSERGPIIHAPINVIEQLGGGSARCMIAEIYLPGVGAPVH
ncbi:MAG: citrulline utilization hydrolase CtlX [Saprospiraceae bacterium]